MKKLLLLLLIAISGTAFGQSSKRFDITRSVIAGGGATFSDSSRFQLGSTVAQPLAAVPASKRFSIQGGFWIFPAPIIFAPAKTGTNFIFSFQSDLGMTYTVQFSASLSQPSWTSLPSVIGNGGVETVTNSAPNASQLYYRLIEVEQ